MHYQMDCGAHYVQKIFWNGFLEVLQINQVLRSIFRKSVHNSIFVIMYNYVQLRAISSCTLQGWPGMVSLNFEKSPHRSLLCRKVYQPCIHFRVFGAALNTRCRPILIMYNYVQILYSGMNSPLTNDRNTSKRDPEAEQ